MADEIDRQLERDQQIEELRVKQIRSRAAQIPAGEPGECHHCGEDFARLINRACARCRDRLKLP